MPRWLLHTLLTMLLWGGWGVVSKPLADNLSAWQVQSLSTLGLIPVIVWLTASHRPSSGANRRRGFGQAFAAGLITSAGNVACYQALAAGGKAAAVIPLTSLYPLVTIVLAMLLLHERLRRIQAAGIAASLTALYCFNGGSETSLLSPWLAVALVPIALWGVGALLQKVATTHVSAEQATLAFLVGFLPVSMLTPLCTSFEWRLPGATWLLLLLLGFLFGLGNLTLIHAYSTGGRASVVTPMASLYSLVTIPLAVVLLAEPISLLEGLGIGLALLAVLAFSCESTPEDETAPTSPDTQTPGLPPSK